MAISFTCPKCGTELKVQDDVGGKQGLCPACNNAITIPRVTGARRQVEEVEGSASVVEPELIDEDPPRRSDRREEDEDRPQGSHLGMRREKLGSLAQAARSKHLRQLRGVLIFLAVLTIGVNVYLLVTGRTKSATSSTKTRTG